MAIKQKPKNRKKAHKPKQYIFSNTPPKSREFEMSWNLKDAESTIDLYCLMHDIDLETKDLMPLSLLQSIYKGDLIIALRQSLISSTQEYKITITSKARRFDDPSVTVPVKPFHADFTGNAINYRIFMSGEEQGKHYFKRDGIYNVIWQGLTKEWKRDLDEQYSDEYEIFDSHATLSCHGAFISLFDEVDFNAIKNKSFRGRYDFQSIA